MIATELVDRTLGSMVPVNVKLSPPSRFREVDGNILVKVQSISSATSKSELGIMPRLLVRIGK